VSSWLEWSGLAAVARNLVDDAEQRLAILIFAELFENSGIQSIRRAYGTALTEGVNLGAGQLASGHQIPIGGVANLCRVAIAQETLDIGGALIRQEPCVSGGSVQSEGTEHSNQHFLHAELFSR